MSEPCGSLPCMASDDPRTATVTDPDGREVVLLARIWAEKIADDHPELIDQRDAVIQTVSKPDHVEPDAPPNPRNPNATPSASRCGAGSLSRRSASARTTAAELRTQAPSLTPLRPPASRGTRPRS